MLVSRTAINSVSTHVGYDDNGNMNKAPVPSDMANHHYVCTYDFRNRLVKVETDGQTPKKVAEYFYDGLNRRIRKITYDANEDEVSDTRYLYDGWRCIEERDVNDSSELRARYVYGGLYVDEPVRMYRDTNDNGDFTDEGDTNVYYLQDRLFNVAALTDTDGAIVERTWYEPYGQPTNRRESDDDETTASHFGNPMLFCGYRYDDETELYHVRRRYYHPALGRWISRDLEGYVDGTNLYEYVGSEAVGAVDPSGESSRAVSSRGDITIDSKQIYDWTDEIRKPGARLNFWWNFETIQQTTDFMVYLQVDYTLTVEIANAKGDSGTLVTLGWSEHNYVIPNERVISGAVYGDNPPKTMKTLEKALKGKLCRKAVYVKQNCCIKHKRTTGWPWNRKTKISHTYEDRWIKVYLYGSLIVPGNSIPMVAQCDVSGAETKLADTIKALNAKKHSMCTDGLKIEGAPNLSSENKLLDSLPSGGFWSSGKAVSYKKGEHHSLRLFSRGRYHLR